MGFCVDHESLNHETHESLAYWPKFGERHANWKLAFESTEEDWAMAALGGENDQDEIMKTPASRKMKTPAPAGMVSCRWHGKRMDQTSVSPWICFTIVGRYSILTEAKVSIDLLAHHIHNFLGAHGLD